MNQWWGYKHINGTFHPKRYFSNEDLLEAIESPFVEIISNVFMAEDREDALIKLKQELE